MCNEWNNVHICIESLSYLTDILDFLFDHLCVILMLLNLNFVMNVIYANLSYLLILSNIYALRCEIDKTFYNHF